MCQRHAKVKPSHREFAAVWRFADCLSHCDDWRPDETANSTLCILDTLGSGHLSVTNRENHRRRRTSLIGAAVAMMYRVGMCFWVSRPSTVDASP